jgi:hypothetical protein
MSLMKDLLAKPPTLSAATGSDPSGQTCRACGVSLTIDGKTYASKTVRL